MITFLWMLYLAFTIFITYTIIVNTIFDIVKITTKDMGILILAILTCLLWAIWYMYFLH